jgi:hypothetical protein
MVTADPVSRYRFPRNVSLGIDFASFAAAVIIALKQPPIVADTLNFK